MADSGHYLYARANGVTDQIHLYTSLDDVEPRHICVRCGGSTYYASLVDAGTAYDSCLHSQVLSAEKVVHKQSLRYSGSWTKISDATYTTGKSTAYVKPITDLCELYSSGSPYNYTFYAINKFEG